MSHTAYKTDVTRRGRAASYLALAILIAGGCHPANTTNQPPGPSDLPDRPMAKTPPTHATPTPSTTGPDYTPPAAKLPLPDHETDRWLVVDKVRGDAPGAWATASFDRKRNKLIIDTQDVAGMVLDMSRIPIDWGRRVILAIDGKNSQLKRRETRVYRFVHDEFGRWLVDE